MNAHPNVVKNMEKEMARLSYEIDLDEWVFKYDGAKWKAPKEAVALSNGGPYAVQISVAWLLTHGERIKVD